VAIDVDLRGVIGEMFRLHPVAFARQSLRPEHVAKLGEINYQIIRHALERDLRSRSMLKDMSAS
jgi:hypothetical protein